MGRNNRKNIRLIRLLALIFVLFFAFSAAEIFVPAFPAAADNFTGILLDLLGEKRDITFFVDSSVFLKQMFYNAEFFVETVYGNIFEEKKEIPQITGRLFSCAASNPLNEYAEVTSDFGNRRFDGKTEHHGGIDFAAKNGENVLSAWPGKVLSTGYDTMYGNFVIIEHSRNLSTRYCHLSEISVKQGDKILAEEPIGKVGTTGRSTGNHLHFEIIFKNAVIDPKECLEL